MRFTLGPAGDVEVPDGIELSACRPGLVELVGSTALACAPLSVRGRRLAEDQVAGVEPWVEGCRVAVGDEGALVRQATGDARWQVVVVDGPDAGAWADAGRGRWGRLTVGRGAGGPDLPLSDPAVVERHGTVLRVLGTWWWLARSGVPVPRPAGRRRGVRAGGDVLVPVRLPAERAAPPPGPVWAWLAPAGGTLAMALVLRTPVLALLALATLAPLLARLPRPRPARPWGPTPAEATVLGARARGAADGDPGAGSTAPVWWPKALDGLALVGPREQTLAAARALLGASLADPALRVRLVTGHPEQWDWCRWWPRVVVGPPADGGAPGPPGAVAGRRLVVVDTEPDAALHRWWSARGGAGTLLLAERRDQVPAWCRRVVDVESERCLPRASAAWADAQARALAAGTGPAAGLPQVVSLADLLERTGPGPAGLSAPIGMGAGGPVAVDLLADGPHLLVAGTTGAGKSELLQTLVLGLAARYGPDRLAVMLVDFKGGAGLGACHGLPHVVGEVTDLDPRAAERALTGVRAELARRERLLADAGVGDLEALRTLGQAPPRLVVVVDELLALREDLPDVLPALIRLASQGRSLGIHLVLATQRPAGALDAQVRANVPLRLCLRVTDPSDSRDVIGTDDAAAIAPDLPGRAVLRRADLPVEAVQTAWAALPPSADGPAWAEPWPPPHAGERAADHVATLAASIARTWAGRPRPTPLWRPGLPERCTLDEVAGLVGGPGTDLLPGADRKHEPGARTATPTDALVLGLVDLPGEQRTAALTWLPSQGPLLLTGPAGAGRSTALRTVAQAALRAGRHVHVLHGSGWTWPEAPSPGRGTVVGTDDPRLALRLVERLTEPEGRSGRAILLVDDVARVLRALATMPRGVGEGVLDTLRAAGVPFACAGGARDLRSLAGTRVRLGPDEDAARPSARAWPPGRGVRDADGAECHVAVPSEDRRATRRVVPATPTALRLAPLPVGVVDVGPGTAPWTAPLGRGGDQAAQVVADLSRGLLVVGPAGSGRSTVLDRIDRHAPQGVELARPSARDLPDLVAAWQAGSGSRRLVLLDDADLALRGRPDLDERLAEWVLAAEQGDPTAPRVAATARTDRVAATFRGVVATLRGAAPILVLDPLATGSGDAAGTDLSRAVDPRRVPGRAVLLVSGRPTPVQLAGPCARDADPG
ncbi:MAG: hypothetical protein KQH57_06660 [Actinomycetales bacterium]|nr:hypothetical protein [Actinomycetales bacterium]